MLRFHEGFLNTYLLTTVLEFFSTVFSLSNLYNRVSTFSPHPLPNLYSGYKSVPHLSDFSHVSIEMSFKIYLSFFHRIQHRWRHVKFKNQGEGERLTTWKMATFFDALKGPKFDKKVENYPEW